MGPYQRLMVKHRTHREEMVSRQGWRCVSARPRAVEESEK